MSCMFAWVGAPFCTMSASTCFFTAASERESNAVAIAHVKRQRLYAERLCCRPSYRPADLR